MSQNETHILVLDQPCSYCRLLELDDPKHDGGTGHDLKDHPHVNFIEVHEKEEKSKDSSTSIYKSLVLRYERHDMLPGLPGLAETASRGCVFCKVLRNDLISATTRDGKSNHQGASAEETNTRKLIITGMYYEWGYTATLHDGKADTRLKSHDALYVSFTIDSGDKQTKQRLYYNLYLKISDTCAQWSSLGRLPTSHDRLSDSSLIRMKALIARSLHESPFENKNGYLPTRLLDLQARCTSALRLVITQEDTDVQKLDHAQRRYVALSYCWGSSAEAKFQLKTTHATLASRKSEIQLSEVPKTISDAIKLCRKLGIRYLWVDSLCIIQHDPQDWAKESFQMSQIYSNSFITLCIIKGDSCLSGFLKASHTPPTVQIGFRSRINSSITGCINLCMLFAPRDNIQTHNGQYYESVGKTEYLLFDADLDKGAWGTRGWTFQEEELSPRKLYFGEHTFYVSSGQLCEGADGRPFSRRSFFIDTAPWLKRPEVELTLGQWYELISAYSQRKLTFPRDRLPALSALARSVCGRFPEQRYLAGLWASDLHRGLLWTSTSRMPFEQYYRSLEERYIAPSWSWASCPLNSVQWVDTITEPRFRSEITLVHDDIVTDKENPYGIVTSGRLNVRGKIFKPPLGANGRITVRRGKHFNYLETGSQHYVLWSGNNEYIAHLDLDWDWNSTQHDDRGCPHGPMNQLSLLLVSTSTMGQFRRIGAEKFNNRGVAFGILIRLKPGAEKAYEKLGIWCSDPTDLGGPDFWKTISMQELTLV